MWRQISDYTAWPKKNATHAIVNFFKVIQNMSLVIISWVRTFFFQQNDTMIINFDWGVWIWGLFFGGNVVSKIYYFLHSSDHQNTEIFSRLNMPYQTNRDDNGDVASIVSFMKARAFQPFVIVVCPVILVSCYWKKNFLTNKIKN